MSLTKEDRMMTREDYAIISRQSIIKDANYIAGQRADVEVVRRCRRLANVGGAMWRRAVIGLWRRT